MTSQNKQGQQAASATRFKGIITAANAEPNQKMLQQATFQHVHSQLRGGQHHGNANNSSNFHGITSGNAN